MLAVVGLFALAFAFWEMLWPLYLIAAGPFCGAVIERARGRDGIRGGFLGGMLCFSGFVIVAYALMYQAGYTALEYFAAILVLAAVALFGGLIGLAVGCIVEAVAYPILGFSTRQNDDSTPATKVSLFDRELPKMTREE
jgi:hypothetical protein